MDSGNPYTSYPLWHYFSLQFQNISLMGDSLVEFRAIDGSFDVNDHDLVGPLSEYITVYDFMNDSILRLSTISKVSRVIMYTGAAALLKAVKNKTIAPDTVVVVKNAPTQSGDMIPFIGTASKMSIIIQLLVAASRNTPYNFRAQLSNEENAKIDRLLERPIYTSSGIARILGSYKECSVPKSDNSNLVNAITKRIAMFIEGKYKTETSSINIEKGTVSNAKNDKTILEFKVQLDRGAPINIKFAFPLDIPNNKKDAYIEMLKTHFKAEQVHTPSDDERRSTQLRPVRIESNSISSIFGSTDEFSRYIETINQRERPESIDTTSVLSELGTYKGDDEDDVDEDEDNTYEED